MNQTNERLPLALRDQEITERDVEVLLQLAKEQQEREVTLTDEAVAILEREHKAAAEYAPRKIRRVAVAPL